MEYQDEDARILEDMEQNASTSDHYAGPHKFKIYGAVGSIDRLNTITTGIQVAKNRKDIPLGEYSTNEPEEHQCEDFNTFN